MTDIFNSETTAPQESQATDPVESILKGILNERGEQKYDSLPKALDGLKHAQEYIPTLKQSLEEKERELAQLREELGKRQSVEEVVSKLITKQPAPVEESVEPTPSSTQLDEQSVGALIERVLQQRTQADQAKMNVTQVQEALLSAYGERTPEVVAAKAAELGITPEDIGLMAQKSPKVVLELFSKSTTPTKPATTSSVNTNAFLPKDSGEMPKPARSLLSGASTKDVLAYQRELRDYIYKKFNVET